MTPQTTPLYLIIHFEDGDYDRYPVIGWAPSNAGPDVWAPVVAIWDNRVALTIYGDTRVIMFGDHTRIISTAYLGGSK